MLFVQYLALLGLVAVCVAEFAAVCAVTALAFKAEREFRRMDIYAEISWVVDIVLCAAGAILIARLAPGVFKFLHA